MAPPLRPPLQANTNTLVRIPHSDFSQIANLGSSVLPITISQSDLLLAGEIGSLGVVSRIEPPARCDWTAPILEPTASEQRILDVQMLSPPSVYPIRLLCNCKESVLLNGDVTDCICGARLAYRENGVIVIDDGDRGIASLDHGLLEAAEDLGWRRAITERFAAPSLRVSVLGTAIDFLPVPDGSLSLDATAGYGRLAAELAQAHDVVALAPNPSQARFLAIRKRQDQLHRLTIFQGDFFRTNFHPSQFHAAVVAPIDSDHSGSDLWAMLQRVRDLVVPGGLLYLGIGNRYGFRRLFASLRRKKPVDLLPAPVGYLGYRSFFRSAGMEMIATWISLLGAGDPTVLTALNHAAIVNALEKNYGGPLRETHWARSFLDRILAVPWLWRLAGDHYSFLLRVADA